MNIRLTGSFLAASLSFLSVTGLQAQDQLSNTEKAAAIAAIGACSAASAHAWEHDQGPNYTDTGKVVTVEITNTAGERVPVYLYPRNGGWFGPRGEFYRTLPKTRYLAAVYGSRRATSVPAPVAEPPAKPQPQAKIEKPQPQPVAPEAKPESRPAPKAQPPKHLTAAPGGPLKAEAGRGRLKILDGDKTVSTLRTSMPDIVDWKFADKQRQVIVKSRGKQGGAVVELFNTRTGTLQDKVPASEIKKSRESWAKGFED
ncbi:hypothetical protein [Luteolibacter luteus]|uniref:DUF2782 domain-containing protein n=1 Tax=Luteolibacter luteus TaxID=2728835 RepID=A0A858RQ80_9BACT|nr:hypothetical protein [Luteolibacter luteus]QJE98083.1 hypothetical protein HHL09_20605 [Luteolibacter luteus]